MALDIRPATAARFDDVVTILGPKRAGAQGCWCLSSRLGHARESELIGMQARSQAMAALCRRRSHAPGVLAYDDDEVVGWAAVSPRSELHEYAGHDRYRVDGDPGGDPWVIFCIRVRAGHGGQGVASALVDGAAAYAVGRGADAVVGYPVDPDGDRIDRTLASVGLLGMFEAAGFERVAAIGGRRAGHRQVLVLRTT